MGESDHEKEYGELAAPGVRQPGPGITLLPVSIPRNVRCSHGRRWRPLLAFLPFPSLHPVFVSPSRTPRSLKTIGRRGGEGGGFDVCLARITRLCQHGRNFPLPVSVAAPLIRISKIKSNAHWKEGTKQREKIVSVLWLCIGRARSLQLRIV